MGIDLLQLPPCVHAIVLTISIKSNAVSFEHIRNCYMRLLDANGKSHIVLSVMSFSLYSSAPF